MSASPGRELRRDTRVFISATTRELGSVRKLVKKALEDNDYHAVEQDNFPPDYRELLEKLRNRISSCDAMVHIAGRCYGAEPKQRPADAPRRSYTQLEYDLAVGLGTPVYVFITGDSFPADPHEPEDTERAQLQEAHRQALVSGPRAYERPATRAELDQKVRSLQLQVEKLGGELIRVDEKIAEVAQGQSRRSAVVLTVSLVAVLLLVGVGWAVSRMRHEVPQQVQQEVQKAKAETVTALTDPALLAASIRKQIEAVATAKIAALPDEKGRWEKVAAIEKERDLALAGVDGLIRMIQQQLKEGASSVFQRATEILQKEGIDAALAYLKSQTPSIERSVEEFSAHIEAEKTQLYRELQPLQLRAQLMESKLDWRGAVQVREKVAKLAPDWFEAQTLLGNLLLELARFQDAEPHLRAAMASAKDPNEEATGLNNLARLLRATNHRSEAEPLYRRALAIDEKSYGPEDPHVATVLNNLAGLLRATNRLSEAEPLYRRALAIDEKSYGPEHPEIATDLNNLAQLLHDTNRLSEAEPFLRRALAIDEKSYGPKHPHVATVLNNLAQLLHDTNRLSEAEPLMRRAVAIDEKFYGPEHPHVAIRVNNLAGLLQATNRLSEAEPLMRRALAIDEKSYGPEHPEVATDLNNLAQLLQATNRLTKAEPLMRRALAIDETSYGPEHPDVAIRLNNLAKLLQATNRLAEAEPLMRRHVAIFYKFGRSTGHEHPHMRAALNNYSQLLKEMRLDDAEIRRRLAPFSPPGANKSPAANNDRGKPRK